MEKYFCGGTAGDFNTLVEGILYPFHRQKPEKKSEHDLVRTAEQYDEWRIRRRKGSCQIQVEEKDAKVSMDENRGK
jgi:hypothetical protein